MRPSIVVITTSVILVGISLAADENILCSSAFCVDYVQNNPCPDLPEECIIQNATHSGLVVPYPEVCNCCPYCIKHLRENEFCSMGGTGGFVPDGICGPGLGCNNGICTKLSSACSLAQDAYDSKRLDGTLGMLEVRPECDPDGDFIPYKCIPGQTCFCVDKDGGRMFGEIPFTSAPQNILNCQCSQKYLEATRVIGKELYPHQHYLCASNGNFDSIQCIGEDCYCVDASDGVFTYPLAIPVKMVNISEATLPCFDKDVHKEGEYYPECARITVDVAKEEEDYKKEGFSVVFDIGFPNCALDGKYGPVQQTSTRAYCVDPDGKELGYSVDVSDIDTMDCKCATTVRIMTSVNSTSVIELPECCPNGNFNKLQCRRGLCYCVDRDGYQIEKEVDQSQKSTLSCYNNECTF